MRLVKFKYIYSSHAEIFPEIFINPEHIVTINAGTPLNDGTLTTVIALMQTEEGNTVDYKVIGEVHEIAKELQNGQAERP
ncbi:MAG: hypothetical protein ACWGQW_02675 [bacterium]